MAKYSKAVVWGDGSAVQRGTARMTYRRWVDGERRRADATMVCGPTRFFTVKTKAKRAKHAA